MRTTAKRFTAFTAALTVGAITARAEAQADATTSSSPPLTSDVEPIEIHGDSEPAAPPVASTTPPEPIAQPVVAVAETPPAQPTRREPLPRHWMLRPHFGFLFGTTGYTLSATISGIRARSALDYSIDSATAGLDVAYLGGGHGSRPFALAFSFATNVSDPFGTLLDRDYFAVGSGSETEFSHTDSRLTGRVYVADLSASIGLAGWQRRTAGPVLDLIVGYRHEAMSFDAWGIEGWQLDSSGRTVSVFLGSETRGIHYETHKILPNIGLAMHGHVTGTMLLDARASALLAVSVDDDDHVLRFKRGTATSTGAGFLLQVAPRWIVAGRESGPAAVAIGFDAQLRYLAAWGTLHQRFYADDPSLPGDQRSSVIPDADFVATSLSVALRLTLDVMF